MSQARALSADEVRSLQQELAGGGTPTVWFTSSAVGVQEGRSGKVVALSEPADGDFIQVRPAGSKDVLSFSVAEVTLVKPPRKRKEAESAPKARNTGRARSTASEDQGKSGADEGRRAASAPARASATTGSPNGRSSGGPSPRNGGRSAGSGGREGASGARRKPRQPTPATVTLAADEAGQWSVEVSTGKKRLLRPKAVPASAVAQAAKALHEDVASAVEPLIAAARVEQQARIEQLQQELADAQRMLDELG